MNPNTTPTPSAPVTIRIIKCTDPSAWYSNRVGQTMTVERFEKNVRPAQGIPEDVYWCREGGEYNPINYVRSSDCVLVAPAAADAMTLARLRLYVTGGVERELDPWETNEFNDLASIIAAAILADRAQRDADTRRLDWLDEQKALVESGNGHQWQSWEVTMEATARCNVRQAIDAAMYAPDATGKEGKKP